VNRTKLGRAMRATAENPRVAGLMGVKPDVVISATFIIGAMLAAIAGVMWASNYGTASTPWVSARPEGLYSGGVWRHWQSGGAVVGGILLGLIESIGAGYIGA
jgi:branched-chain amino acid transport system permease protein